MDRITRAQLESVVTRINSIAGMPPAPYYADAEGRYHAAEGNFHLEEAYGGTRLLRMMRDGGSGTQDITGRMSRRELYHALHAFRDGLSEGREVEGEAAYAALLAAGHDPVALAPAVFEPVRDRLRRREEARARYAAHEAYLNARAAALAAEEAAQ